jgi:hypothetical protein
MHPLLIWDCHIPATVAVFQSQGFRSPYKMKLSCEDVPGFGTDEVILRIDPSGIGRKLIERVKRTFSFPTLVEMAAISIAALSLNHAGEHQLADMAVLPSRAEYVVGEEGVLLEVAGRSDRSNFNSAWDVRWERLREEHGYGFFLSVTEFETPFSRLAFATTE